MLTVKNAYLNPREFNHWMIIRVISSSFINAWVLGINGGSLEAAAAELAISASICPISAPSSFSVIVLLLLLLPVLMSVLLSNSAVDSLIEERLRVLGGDDEWGDRAGWRSGELLSELRLRFGEQEEPAPEGDTAEEDEEDKAATLGCCCWLWE